MTHLHARTTTSILMAATLAAGACAPVKQNLIPAASANDVMGMEGAATASENGVRVFTRSNTWPGEAEISERVTQLYVRIENTSRAPVSVRFQDFALVARDGSTYRAIPPMLISGTVDVPPGPFTAAFAYSGFAVAPGYAYAYPGVEVWHGPFVYDGDYLGSSYRYWSRTSLPTPAMLAWALPEGVVKVHGEVEGFLYFPHVAKDVEHVRFEAKLDDADKGEQLATVSIPFEVKR